MYRCSYCKGEINKTDVTCHNCGANVSEMLNYNYNIELPSTLEIEKTLREKKNANIGIIDHIIVVWFLAIVLSIFFGIFKMFIVIPIFIIIATIITIILQSGKNSRLKYIKGIESKIDEKSPKNYSLKCDAVQELKYQSSWFEAFPGNKKLLCPDGYKPIVLHIIVKNHAQSMLILTMENVRLLVDGIDMTACPVKRDFGFRDDLNPGELLPYYESFTTRSVPSIYPNTYYDGWVGFFITRDAKRFEIKIGNENYIMDNPLYK